MIRILTIALILCAINADAGTTFTPKEVLTAAKLNQAFSEKADSSKVGFGVLNGGSGSIDSSVDGNTMQVIGATFSKPDGKPTMTVVGDTDVRNIATCDGVANDYSHIQAYLNTGKSLSIPAGITCKVSQSLYMFTSGQELSGAGTITMDSSLGKPIIWLGAIDSSGTLPSSAVVGAKITNIVFQGTGTPIIGSAGVAYGKATTSPLTNVKSWGFYSGVDIRGTSLANTIVNPDLRYNTIGFNDRCNSADGAAGPDFQGSSIIAGRIEANVAEGMVIGSANVKLIGPIVEGNGSGNNTAQIRYTPGYQTGSEDIWVYMETLSTSTAPSFILVDVGASRRLNFLGGSYYGGGTTASQYVVQTLSTSTTQAFSFSGGQYSNFINFVQGAASGNSSVYISPGVWSDTSKTVTDDFTANLGASVWQVDRANGLKTNQRLSVTKNDAATGVSSYQSGSGLAGVFETDGTGTGVLMNSTGTGDPLNVANSGVNKLRVDASGNVYTSKLFVGAGSGASSGAGQIFLGQITAANVANQGMLITGNKDAADTGADVNLNSSATRTSGYLATISNNGSTKFAVDYAGNFIFGGISGPQHKVGAGAPASTFPPIGSLYSRTDGGVGSSLYIKDTSTTWSPVPSGIISAGSVTALTPSSTISLDASTGSLFTLTPAQTETINVTNAIAGQRFDIAVLTSGTNSYVLTFGTNFKSTGTLTTGATSGKYFEVSFICTSSTNCIERSRTVAQ